MRKTEVTGEHKQYDKLVKVNMIITSVLVVIVIGLIGGQISLHVKTDDETIPTPTTTPCPHTTEGEQYMMMMNDSVVTEETSIETVTQGRPNALASIGTGNLRVKSLGSLRQFFSKINIPKIQ